MKIEFHSKEKESINKRKRSILFLVAGLVCLAALGTLIYYASPTSPFTVLNYSVPIIPLFMLLLFITLFFWGSYAFKSKTHGVLIGVFTIIYLIFRLNNLTHPFFFILLFALFLTLELFVSYRR